MNACRCLSLTAVLTLACTGPAGPQGPQGEQGPPGQQGPPGTFSGTFNGNVTVNGTITATNLLATESFTGWLTNAADFTAPTGGTPVILKYTDVRQNSDTSVFRPELDGSLTILKAGVVNLSATYDVIGPTNYAEIRVALNGTIIAQSLAPSNGANWSQPSATVSWKINAGDAFSILALPAQITSMDNGAYSRLTVQWTGLP